MRKRLTARNVRAESQADGLFPGDIGNEERAQNYHNPDEYSNYDWQKGWDTPDPNAPKIDDKRDEIGFGIPKAAEVYQTAKQAAILAQLYLGDEAPDEAIEDQARDFMKLGHRRIVASIRRWKATEVPAEPTAPAEEGEKEAGECPECGAQIPDNAQGEACKVGEEPEAPATPAEPEVTPEPATPEAGEGEENPVAPENTEPDVNEVTAEEGEDAPELEIEIPEAGDGNAPDFGSESELAQANADPELVALFNGEEPPAEPAPEAPTASKKAGVKHLGGQPRLASVDANGLKELEGIWNGLKIPSL